MKLEVLQTDLAKALSITSRLASPKAQLPILGNILFSAKKNKLLLVSTNLETSVSLQVGARTSKVGDLAIPARVVTDVVANMPKGNVLLESTKEKLKVSVAKYSTTVSGMHSADFPDVPLSIGSGFVNLPLELFLEALSKVLFSVSVDETRPVLTGVLFIVDGGEMVLASTDGFRLSRKKLVIPKSGNKKRLILPKNALSELTRLANSARKLKMELPQKESLAIFELDDTILSSRVIQGEFPDFEKIIPKSSDIVVDVDKEELARAIKVSSVFARDSANTINVEVTKGEVSISSQSKQTGRGEVSVDAKVEGLKKDTFSIAFNYKFIEDFLNSVKGENVVVKFTEPNAPGVFLDPQDRDYLHLIMPVKV